MLLKIHKKYENNREINEHRWLFNENRWKSEIDGKSVKRNGKIHKKHGKCKKFIENLWKPTEIHENLEVIDGNL